jgi:hypothetical protein
MRNREAVLVSAGLALGMSSCAHAVPLSNAYSRVDAATGERCAFGALHEDGKCDIYEVSLAELFAIPERFDGKRVRVGGHVTLAFEHNVLCERRGQASSCLWLDVEHLRDPGFRTGWATVEGTFNGENRGHLGCCAGTIEASTMSPAR